MVFNQNKLRLAH